MIRIAPLLPTLSLFGSPKSLVWKLSGPFQLTECQILLPCSIPAIEFLCKNPIKLAPPTLMTRMEIIFSIVRKK